MQIMNGYECDGTLHFHEMKDGIQIMNGYGFNGTHLSPNENICTIARMKYLLYITSKIYVALSFRTQIY